MNITLLKLYKFSNFFLKFKCFRLSLLYHLFDLGRSRSAPCDWVKDLPFYVMSFKKKLFKLTFYFYITEITCLFVCLLTKLNEYAPTHSTQHRLSFTVCSSSTVIQVNFMNRPEKPTWIYTSSVMFNPLPFVFCIVAFFLLYFWIHVQNEDTYHISRRNHLSSRRKILPKIWWYLGW